MPHFSALARFGFSVEVELGARVAEHSTPVRRAVFPKIAQNVPHHDRPQKLRRSEWKPAYSAELLLKLARHAGVEGEVSRVVRSRGKFIDQKFAVGCQEKFHRQQTHDIELAGNFGSEFLCLFQNRCGKTRWHDREVENVVGVDVF